MNREEKEYIVKQRIFKLNRLISQVNASYDLLPEEDRLSREEIHNLMLNKINHHSNFSPSVKRLR